MHKRNFLSASGKSQVVERKIQHRIHKFCTAFCGRSGKAIFVQHLIVYDRRSVKNLSTDLGNQICKIGFSVKFLFRSKRDVKRQFPLRLNIRMDNLFYNLVQILINYVVLVKENRIRSISKRRKKLVSQKGDRIKPAELFREFFNRL